ncbi:hypothetical protein [Aurantiacibacter gangjinensis]|uniref:Uncharacterized protein n=1 Tax=Aurantiacibacter gangjinensis TaxID=502682 RepID=A0A0G9MQY6_9SPHN|nr:hypothetical protein [Aurantiacibacter gangjinensis]APE28903.1 hypothetical protein BMF35_a2074 [Aurantiacibacter gangjinensis]KLE33029.1 hypothetical protein AAW01_03250 [Aurantiacibacter gangjinensis]
MHTFRYSIAKLLTLIALGVGLYFVGDWMSDVYQRKRWFLGIMMMGLGPFCSISGLIMLLNRDVMTLHPDGKIGYFKWTGRQSATWRDYRGMNIQQASGSTHLQLDFGKGYFGNCHISVKLLEKEHGDVRDVMTVFHAFLENQHARASGNYTAPEIAHRTRPAAQAPQPAAPVGGGFGRKGL